MIKNIFFACIVSIPCYAMERSLMIPLVKYDQAIDNFLWEVQIYEESHCPTTHSIISQSLAEKQLKIIKDAACACDCNKVYYVKSNEEENHYLCYSVFYSALRLALDSKGTALLKTVFSIPSYKISEPTIPAYNAQNNLCVYPPLEFITKEVERMPASRLVANIKAVIKEAAMRQFK